MLRSTPTIGGSVTDFDSELRLYLAYAPDDLHEERRQLLEVVLPEIERICADRGVSLRSIDGWREPDAERVSPSMVVRRALDRLTGTTPLVIGLLGASRGWIPGDASDSLDGTVNDRYPWLSGAIAARNSLTELELFEAPRHHPNLRDRILLYARQPITDDADISLRASVDRAAALGLELRKDFTTATDLVEAIRADLIAFIDGRWPATRAISVGQRERELHEVFAASRRKAYVEQPAMLDALTRFAVGADDNRTAVLAAVGDSGSGKSSLLSYWSHAYSKDHPDDVIVTHYVGAAGTSSDHTSILRRILRDVDELIPGERFSPATALEVEDDYLSRLRQIAPRRVVLVIDGLNELQPASLNMRWLPRNIPPNVRMILSTQPIDVVDRLEEYGASILQIEPLTREEQREVARKYLLDEEHRVDIDRIGRHSDGIATSNPLYLRTTVEELRLFQATDELDSAIARYTSAANLDELFDRVLERMESTGNPEQIGRVLSLLWATRRGLSVKDLSEALDVDAESIEAILETFTYNLSRRDGRISFFHDHIRRAVGLRYLPDESMRRGQHRTLAAHLKRTIDGDLESTSEDRRELLHHLASADERDRLLQEISTIDALMAMVSEDQGYELFVYWRELDAVDRMAETYLRQVRAAEERGESDETIATYAESAGTFLVSAGMLKEAIQPLRIACAMRRRSGGDELASLDVEAQLGYTLLIVGEYAAAEELVRRVNTGFMRLLGPNHRKTLYTINRLAFLLYRRGELDEAERLLTSLRSVLEAKRDRIALAHALSDLASIAGARARHGEAKELLEQSIDLWTQTLGREHPHTLLRISDLASTLVALGNYAEAERLYVESLAVRRRVMGNENPDLAQGIVNLGTFYRQMNRLEEAEKHYREGIAILENTLGPEHLNTITTLHNLGVLQSDRGLFDEARRTLTRAVDSFRRVHGDRHPSTAVAASSLGSLYARIGAVEEAERQFDEAMTMTIAIHGGDHPSVANILQRLASLKFERAHTEGIELERRALDILCRAHRPTHPLVARCRIELGIFLALDGQAEEAAELYHSARDVIHAAVPPTHRWLRRVEHLAELLNITMDVTDQRAQQ